MITTLTGTNNFLIDQELSKITDKFTKQYGQLAVEKLDGEEAEFERLNEALTNLPFLIEKKLVILRDPSKNRQFNEKIEQIISSLPDATEVVILESKLDKRQSYFKILKTKTDYKELNNLDQNELAKWLVQSAKEKEGNLLPNDANYMIVRLGTNQQLLDSELIKLLDYGKEVNKKTIDLLTEPNPQNSVFDLLDAAFDGQKEKVLLLYTEQRQQKAEPLEILAMIAWQLKILAIIKSANGRNLSEIAQDAKLNPFVVRKSYPVAAKLTFNELRDLLRRALELDVRLKSESIDADDALQYFLLSIA